MTAPGGASVSVPPGAFDEAATITVAGVSGVPPMPAGLKTAGGAVAFTPHGQRFREPVTLRFPAAAAASRVLRLDDESDSTWETVDGATLENGFATVQTSGFSIYVPASASLAPDGSADGSGPPEGSAPEGGGTNESVDCEPQAGASFQTTLLPDGRSGPTAVAVDRDGHPHVIIRDDATRRAYHGTNRSGTWVLTEIEPGTDRTAFALPSLAVQASGAAHVCVNGQYLTSSGGTWGPGDWQGTWSACSVGVGPMDAVYLTGTDRAQAELSTVTNRTGNWTPTVIAPVDSAVHASTAVASDGTLHVAWQSVGECVSHFASGVIESVHCGTLHPPDIAVSTAGQPVIAIFDQLPAVWRLILKRREAATWVEEEVRSDVDSFPRVALDGQDAPHLLYVWRDPTDPLLSPRLQYSVKRAGTWDDRPVNSLAEPPTQFDGFDISVTPRGRPHLTYQDGGGAVVYATLPCAAGPQAP